MNKYVLSVLFLLLPLLSLAQTYHVTGTILDAANNQSLIGVSVVLGKGGNDSIGTATDADGKFSLDNVSPGSYTLRAIYIGYQTTERSVNVLGADVMLGTIAMKVSSQTLNNVNVTAKEVRAEQHGDTSEFNANAYKVNPDATTEDLITKMPGVTNDANGLKVNGETVKQVLVDGKPFFGDDPNAAIKNLPAEVVDKIQVFDNQSDQAKFTGFDDGNTQKAVNIVTKHGHNNGVFGKVTAGYGTDDNAADSRYAIGGNLNFFNGDRRISIVGLANNVNQQNFSSDDLLGVTSSSGGGGGGGGRGGGRGGGGGAGGSGGGGNGGAASSFLVSQQGGITQTQSGGINYSDDWGKKVKVTASYFFNRADNTSITDLTRQYVTTNTDSMLTYQEHDTTHSINYNHRANLRLEWTLDSFNSIFLQPRISYQENTTNRDQTGQSMLSGAGVTSSTLSNYYAKNSGYNLNNTLTLRHRFAKPGRTISLGFGTSYNEKNGNGSIYTDSYTTVDSVTDQQNTLSSTGLTLSGNLTYTEPMSKKSQLMVTYNPSYNRNNSDKQTYNNAAPTSGTGEYTDLDTALTNKYINNYYYQNGGVGYRVSDTSFNLMVSLNAQYATLTGSQSFPAPLSINRNFTDILPQAMFNYRFSRSENLRIMYRTNTDAPSISQLQNIVNNSNPLLLTTGNPDLRQDYAHNLIIRYGKSGGTRGTGFFVFANASYVAHYIGNATSYSNRDTNIGGVNLPSGGELSRPVNLEGNWSGRAFGTYALPLGFLKSNLNLNGGYTYSRTPAIINNQSNFSNNSIVTAGLVLGSNISQNVDFTLSYNGSYNIVENTLSTQTNNKYYSQNVSLRFNYIFLGGFVFNTTVTETLYEGLGAAYDKNYFLWSASLGRKFGKKKEWMADIYAFDILKLNQSISRTITDAYIEDDRTQVLQRYFMLRLTYTIRQFKGFNSMPTDEDGHRHFRGGDGQQRGPGGPPDGGGPPPGGGM